MQNTVDSASIPTVNNITNYMGYIKQHQLASCISRGENRKYPGLQAAAFRRNSSLDIRGMVDAFEKVIGNTLTEMQRRHFLAFSQHYGLPTNLLDFTFSPLISLYFACMGEPDTEGYVYFIQKDRLINISSHLDLINSVFFPRFLTAAEELDDLYNGIVHVFIHNRSYGPEFLRCIDDMLGTDPANESIHSEIHALLKTWDGDSLDALDHLLMLMKKRLKRVQGLETDMPLDSLGTHNRLLVQALQLLVLSVPYGRSFRLPFYFTYEPANITNRVSNQSSVFIYQLYGINDLRQDIIPDLTLKIQNKAEIMEDLDSLGINESFIFNDYDHIASYIRRKYLRLSNEREQAWQRLRRMTQNSPQ